MIFTVIFYLFVFLVSALLYLLPTGGSFPAAFTNGVRDLWDTLWQWNFFIPVSDFIVCVGLVTGFWTFVLVWRFGHWVLRKLPFFGIR